MTDNTEIEWKGDISTALALVTIGWRTDEEHRVYSAARDFLWRVGRSGYDMHLPTCDKCGQRIK